MDIELKIMKCTRRVGGRRINTLFPQFTIELCS